MTAMTPLLGFLPFFGDKASKAAVSGSPFGDVSEIAAGVFLGVCALKAASLAIRHGGKIIGAVRKVLAENTKS